MPRLFTGLEIPADVTFDLDLMKGGIIGGRWIDRLQEVEPRQVVDGNDRESEVQGVRELHQLVRDLLVRRQADYGADQLR